MAAPTKLLPLAPNLRRGWRLAVDGIEVTPDAGLTLEHPRFGALHYGWAPEGYDTWTFTERGGGGAVITPYAVVDGDLLIGVVSQPRRNQGGAVWNCPRGFVDPGEPHAAAAVRELIEETGLVDVKGLVELDGTPGNPNSAFFETNADQGVRFYALEVPAARMQREERGWRVRTDAIDTTRIDASEGVHSLRFLPWTDVARLGDLLSVAAVARLLAHRARS